MDAKLVIVGGKANKSQVLVKLPTVIGRSREADLTVAHPMISRKHCELYEVEGLVRIRDLGSLNGLYVGSRQVNEAALHPNAEFTVGPLTFRIDYHYERRGEVALPPDASTLDDTVEQPEDESPAKAEEPEAEEEVLRADSEPVHVDGEKPRPPEGEAVPGPSLNSTEAQPAIAPLDGGVPEFSAWEDRTEEEDEERAGDPSPPRSLGRVSEREETTPETSGGAEPDLPDTPPADTPPADAPPANASPANASPADEPTPETIALPESDPAQTESEKPDDDALNQFLKGFE